MPLWARVIVLLASAKVVFGITLYLAGLDIAKAPTQVPASVYAAIVGALAGLGGLLVVANRRDARASWLGGMFLLIAASLTPLVNSPEGLHPWVAFWRPEAFVASFFWRFVAEFPANIGARAERIARGIAAAAALVGFWCAAVNVAFAVAPALVAPWSDALVPFLFSSRTGVYWALVLGLTALAFPALLVRARLAQGEERQRVRLFVRALLLGLAPFGIEVLLEELFPAYRAFAHRPLVEPWLGLLIFGALATVPFTTAYSVLFDRVVELRVVLRAALQYALARYTIAVLTLVPFVALALFLFEHRQEPLASLLTGPRPVLLGVAALAGLVSLRLRNRWLAAVDRRYFREPYDAQQVLTRFVGDLQAQSAEELALRIRGEIDRALHADVEVFLINDAGTSLRHVGGQMTPLAATATLAGLASHDPRPMDVDLEEAESPLKRLPEAEQQWVAQGRFRLVVALRTGSGAIAGLLALSEKRSGLIYSSADRHLLSAVASAAGLAIDNLRLRSTPHSPSEPAARQCLECSRLNPPESSRCVCGGAVAIAPAPHVLRGVFRLEQRIGAGGMGVVYRAVDLNLGRDVAIKTLPRVTAGHVARLRKEARAMAAVTHPNLAVIHGIETWQGIPFLVEEYLAGGTLADRLVTSRLSISEVIALGVTLAEALEQLHSEGILHCDIKPSNIGFTQRGVVKLLDFGLARLLGGAGTAPDAPTKEQTEPPQQPVAASASGVFAGTPSYMSPEAVRGDRPTPAFDIWALSVVLFEAIAGRRPFEGRDATHVFYQITAAPRPDLRHARPDCPEVIAALFDRLLALSPLERPQDARLLRRELQSLRQTA